MSGVKIANKVSSVSCSLSAACDLQFIVFAATTLHYSCTHITCLCLRSSRIAHAHTSYMQDQLFIQIRPTHIAHLWRLLYSLIVQKFKQSSYACDLYDRVVVNIALLNHVQI